MYASFPQQASCMIHAAILGCTPATNQDPELGVIPYGSRVTDITLSRMIIHGVLPCGLDSLCRPMVMEVHPLAS